MSDNNTQKFENFLLSEYQNIAQAHFKSIETISSFFRYYLLIMSIPISSIAVISQIGSNKENVSSIILKYNLPISFIIFCISLIGLGIFGYIINLRFDSVLYARVVNGIRKYFYDASELEINFKLRQRALPQSPQLPSYHEKRFFLPVVFVFAIMNSLYFFTGLGLFNLHFFLNEDLFKATEGGFITCIKELVNIILAFPLSFVLIAFFFFSHFVIYSMLAYRRETSYLKSNIIGIDIDGVLNKHREHFCSLLKKNANKELNPEDILVMPVHEDARLNITREDERNVFNDPTYWDEMPAIENASNVIARLKNIFKLKIFIFTCRPWPDVESTEQLIDVLTKFIKKSQQASSRILLLRLFTKGKLLHKYKFIKNIINWLKEEPLILITKRWLKNHNFKCDKFVFEKGNDYSSDPRGKFRNRFYIGRKKKLRFFVEDDLEKAIKLSYICDVVFLLSHPYNEPNEKLPPEINKLRENFPSNIIRVKNWNEIYQHARRLL